MRLSPEYFTEGGGEHDACTDFFSRTSNGGRLPHLSQREHIYISSPQGILEDEVSSNWI